MARRIQSQYNEPRYIYQVCVSMATHAQLQALKGEAKTENDMLVRLLEAALELSPRQEAQVEVCLT